MDLNAYELSADPTRTYVAPDRQDLVPYIGFAEVQNAVARLNRAATAVDGELARAVMSGQLENAAEINGLMRRSERLMTREEGLPRRPWFRHQIYAPGFYTGYGVKTLPGIREAIEQRGWDEAEEQMVFVARAIDDVAEVVERIGMLIRDE